MLKTISPIDGSVYVKREYANTNEIEKTLSNATEIVNEWKNTDLQIRKKLINLSINNNFEPIFPPKNLCSDNAAMIAWAGIERFRLSLIHI